MKGNVEFTKDDEYYTPKSVVDYFGGNFDYDPATNDYKANEFGVKEYDTIQTDGLKRDWTKYKRIWVNPPFTKKFEFLKKAVETYKQNPYIYIYICLPQLKAYVQRNLRQLQETSDSIYICLVEE